MPTATAMINGPEGRLEARYSAGNRGDAPVALFLHPHPQHGGTMNNKVIYNLYRMFEKRGFSVLRFNFRGVGLSHGSYSKGEGELADAAAALDWLQTKNMNAKYCWIIGFSFGAWIGMQLLMRRPDVVSFIAVAPPSNLYDFSFLAPCPAAGLVVQGEKDIIVPVKAQDQLMQRLAEQKRVKVSYKIIEGADHFFSTHMPELQRITSEYLDSRIQMLNKGKIAVSAFGGLEDLGDEIYDNDMAFLDDEDIDDEYA